MKKTLAMIFGKEEESRKRLSPLYHVSEKKGIPPFLVIHIEADPQRAQSKSFVAKLKAKGVAARIHSAGKKGHKKLDEEMGLDGDGATMAVFDFLEELSAK
ncbi:MAG: S9 family peptidase [Planctomycetales bacterium]